jgi:hypothetical protein
MTATASFVMALLLLQYPYPRQSYPRQQNPNIQGGPSADALATFEGTFKSADKKFLTIAVEEGQTMRMYITGSTKFIRDGKPARAADFRHDESVTVEASRDARLNLLAVRVEAGKPAKAPDQKTDR